MMNKYDSMNLITKILHIFYMSCGENDMADTTLDKRGIQIKYFCFPTKTYAVVIHLKRIRDALLMNTHYENTPFQIY